jgi:ELWxxDGT repeat protein
VFFPCQLSGTGYELGASDGTVAGTQQVKDLFAGSSTLIFGIRPVAGDDDFVLVDHDFRLAYSNGIAATTQLVPQDPTLPTIRTIYEAVRIGDRIFMAADRDDVDSELFALRVDGDGDGVIEYFDTLNVEIGCTCDVGFAPCGNSDPSAGCANSTGFGARLDGSGSTVLGADDLLLSVARMPAFANGLVFVGDTSMPPVPFADGLRCIASPTSRYALKNAGAGGTFSYGPGLAAQSLSLPSSLQFIAGRTLRFQAWYRDGGGPCGSGSNLSNSASATFTP